jgi:hypothetical protein
VTESMEVQEKEVKPPSGRGRKRKQRPEGTFEVLDDHFSDPIILPLES